MKKWMSMLVLSVSMAMLISGCNTNGTNTTNQVTEGNKINEASGEKPAEENVPEETKTQAGEEQVISNKVPIEAVSEVDFLEGLNLGSAYTLETADGNVDIELYAAAEVDENGGFVLDDGQEWALVARKGDIIYPLVGCTYIQNGGLNYTVYIDYDQNEMPHILVEIHSGSSMSYYDCTYEAQGFMRETILDAGNVNVLYKF
ncbi:hypothetical protein [Cellulosilyticum ruminicola]|uniref:hypothetical protein n=1 Tax=Cellulosilyticum ruminicola TaxID=425254 RepID=UPI0006CF5BCA|nr:hypothetical protein [Cellulosilyticum ruminicola]